MDVQYATFQYLSLCSFLLCVMFLMFYYYFVLSICWCLRTFWYVFVYFIFANAVDLSQLNTSKSHGALVSEHGCVICNISVFKFV